MNKQRIDMRVLQILMITIIFAGCRNDNILSKMPIEPTPQEYLPLEIGNYWQFRSMSNPSFETRREVMGAVDINNHQYYLLVTSSANNHQTYKDSSYYRIDDNGYVYIYHKNHPGYEDNRFRLNGKNGDTWTYPVENNSLAQLTLSQVPMTLGMFEIKDCKSYYFDVINWADEENTITLAPGIGFIKEHSDAWGFGQILKSARIRGKDFSFF